MNPARHRLGPSLMDFTGNEFQDGATLLVHPERFGRRVEAHAVKVLEESVYRWCPGPGSSADGVAHLGCSAQVAAEGLFLHRAHSVGASDGGAQARQFAVLRPAPRMAEVGVTKALKVASGAAESTQDGRLSRARHGPW